MSFHAAYNTVMLVIANLSNDDDLRRRAACVVPSHRRAYMQAHLARLVPWQRDVVNEFLLMKLRGEI